MFRNRKSKVALVGAALAMLLVSACSSKAPSASGDAKPIVLGGVLTMTSGLSLYGKQQLGAINLAIKEVNDGGGITGRKLELVYEDSNGSNSAALTALNKVLEKSPVALFGPVSGTQMLALQPLIDKEGIPTVTISGTRKVTQQGSTNIFRGGPHDGVAKVALAKYVLDDLKKTKLGLIVVNDEWGYSGRDIVTAVLKDRGMAPAGSQTYAATDTDMSGQLLNLKRAGADVIITQGYQGDTALIFKKARELNLGIPIVTGTDGQMASILDITGGADVDGLTVVGVVIPTHSDDAKAKKFVADYKALNGFEPDIYGTLQYDSVKAFLEGMKKSGPDREAFKKALKEVKYDGINGVYQSDKEGNMLNTVRVMTIDSKKQSKVIKVVTVPENERK